MKSQEWRLLIKVNAWTAGNNQDTKYQLITHFQWVIVSFSGGKIYLRNLALQHILSQSSYSPGMWMSLARTLYPRSSSEYSLQICKVNSYNSTKKFRCFNWPVYSLQYILWVKWQSVSCKNYEKFWYSREVGKFHFNRLNHEQISASVHVRLAAMIETFRLRFPLQPGHLTSIGNFWLWM